MSHAGWNDYSRGGASKSLCKLDCSDVQFRVEWLGNDGSFYHEHVNPLYLDYHKPQEDSDYEALMEASLLVRGDEDSRLQGFQMACADLHWRR